MAGLALNPRWSHHGSESTVYKVDVRYYDGSFDGPAVFIVRNVEVKVGKGAREGWPSEDDRKALRIAYTVQHEYKLDPDKEEYLYSKDTRVWPCGQRRRVAGATGIPFARFRRGGFA